jgi:hypothetical protein
VLDNRVLRRILGQGRDEVTGGWKKLHNEELRDLYSSASIVGDLIGNLIKLGQRGWDGEGM